MGNAMPQPPQNLRPSRFSDAQLMHSIAAKHLPNCALMQATLAAGKSDLALKRLVKPENFEIANLLFLLLTNGLRPLGAATSSTRCLAGQTGNRPYDHS